ncbi:MAG: sigma-70 family RNA polymerase sigma factor [Lachnospiraceae bacterium]|nr:sigma-70 family RNA polymerase sigma factor [Lachnospiraceae bacterium]
MTYTEAINLARAGEERGYGFLYEKTYKSKYYLALQYMKNEEEAEDVLQEAYIKAFSKLDTLENPEAFQGWLGMIVANTAKNMLAKKRPLLFSDLAVDDEGEAFEYQIEDDDLEVQPELSYTRQETKELVHELIDSLSEEQRLCILMFHIEGISISEIARTMDCSENTVKSRLNYGRKNLRMKAEDLQKKGYKLYSVAPLPLFLMLLRSEETYLAAEGNLSAAGKLVADQVFASLSSGEGVLSTTEAVTDAVKGMSKEATKTAGSAVKAKDALGAAGKAGILHTTAGKAAAIVLGICVAGGATFFGVSQVMEARQEAKEAEVQEEIERQKEKEKKEEQAKEPKEVKDSDYSSLIAGNLTKEELEYVLSYGPEEIPNGGFSMEDYMRILNTLCEPSERTGGPVQYYGSTPDYMPQYSVKDVNRLFESFSDFQFTEENDVEQGDYGDVNVDGEKIMFWAATENHVREATITSAEYNSEEMELYYTYSRGAYGDESYIAEKKAILKPNSEGLFKIVSIEEISREALDDSQPTQRKKETVKEDIPTGSYSYVAPVGGLRASMTIQSSGAVRMDTLMSGTGEQDSISYTIRKGSEAYGGVLYTLKGKSSADPVWEFVYYKDGDYFIEKANVEEGMTELKWIK